MLTIPVQVKTILSQNTTDLNSSAAFLKLKARSVGLEHVGIVLFPTMTRAPSFCAVIFGALTVYGWSANLSPL